MYKYLSKEHKNNEYFFIKFGRTKILGMCIIANRKTILFVNVTSWRA